MQYGKMLQRNRRWYYQTKNDPIRYRALREKKRFIALRWKELYPKRYLAQVARQKRRLALNPFKTREWHRAYWQEIKADPVVYKAALEKARKYRVAKMARLKANPAVYRKWRAERSAVNRYFKIRRKYKDMGIAV